MTEEKNKALRSIFHGGAILFVGVLLSKIFGLLFRILVGRSLGPVEYGIIAVMMSAFSLMTTFGHLGIHRGVHRYVAYYRGERSDKSVLFTVRSGYLMILLPSLVVSIGVFVLSPWISTVLLDEERLIWPLRMAAVALPFWGIAKVSIGITNAFEKMQYKVYVKKIWVNFTEVILAFVLIYAGYNYLGAAFAYAFGFLTSAFLGLYFAYKVYPDLFSMKDASYHTGELWQHSWPLFAAGVFAFITGHIDTFMLQYFDGSESVGLYQAAYPFAILLLASNSIFNSIFLSRASYLTSKDSKELNSIFKTVVSWTAIITIPVFLLLFAYPRGALILFGSEFLEVDNILRVLLIGFLLQTVINPAQKVYQAVDKTRIVTILSVLLAIFNFSLNLILIPIYGIMGAAIASTAAFALIFLVKIVYIYKILGSQPFQLSAVKALLAGILTISIIYGVSSLLFEVVPEWFLLVAFALFTGIYPVIFIAMGGVTENDLVILREIDEKTSIDLSPLKKIFKKLN